MEEEFYATIKLVSGEELVSKVCYLTEEDKIMLEKPLIVENSKQRKGQLEVAGFALKEWISATFDNMFVIKKDHVLTMVEIKGEIVDFYEKTLLRMENGKSLAGRGNKLPRDSGYLGSVKEMKKSLEDLFNKS
jgi:ribosomal protein L23